MDFTREPIIETIVTPREGYKLVVRSSKSSGQEEYFVDALEVVSFGSSFFFRTKERPKAFLVPCTDYEVLEVRETRMVIKNVAKDRTIKIAGGKESSEKKAESPKKRGRGSKDKEKDKAKEEVKEEKPVEEKPDTEPKPEKKRERKRQYKKRREARSGMGEEEAQPAAEEGGDAPAPITAEDLTPPEPKPLVPPPSKLISETIAKYKEDDLFREAFFAKGEDGDLVERNLEEHSRVQELLEEEAPKPVPAETEE